MYAAIDLSKYIVSKCIKDGNPISNLQLQRILCRMQEAFLKEKGVRAFGDDIEVWQFGPVVPNVYYRYCGFGAMPISISMEEYSICLSDRQLVDSIVDTERERGNGNRKPKDENQYPHEMKKRWVKALSKKG